MIDLIADRNDLRMVQNRVGHIVGDNDRGTGLADPTSDPWLEVYQPNIAVLEIRYAAVPPRDLKSAPRTRPPLPVRGLRQRPSPHIPPRGRAK